MRQVNITQAKAHLSRLIEQAAAGQPFVIAKAGRPIVKVVALETSEHRLVRRRGFLAGQITIPDNFDAMGEAEIAEAFGLDGD
jgi:prevent-host-death family protein